MDLPLGWSLFLLFVALWNVVIWPRFWQRVAKDERSRDAAGRTTVFYRVHAVIIGGSLLLALGVGLLGILSLV